MTRDFHPADEDALFAEANAWFFRLKSDDVSAEEEAAFEAWRLRSERHADAWREVLDLMRNLEAPARAYHAALAGLSAPDQRPAMRRRRTKTILAGLVAAGLMAVAVVQAPVFLARFGADFVTVAGERRAVTLTDGTRVEMNSDTALGVDFRDGERRVAVLRGEAFFTIAAGTEPFVVEAGAVEVRDIGTAFSVEHGARSRVTVEEGLVDVDTRFGSAPVRVAAGQKTDFSDGKVSTAIAADPVTDLAWRAGQVVFRQERLETVVSELNRHRAGRIFIANPAIADLLVSGVFEIDRPDNVLRALESVLHIQAREFTPYLVLLH